MTFDDGDMSPTEIHGTLLRVVTDEFENGVLDLETRLDFMIRRAEALVGTLVLRNEVRASIDDEG